ncbi:hypothetical protein C1H76_2697 [Elsinoe australis]|uniref:Uncharacterized protein n=1 Tax=Elsinoe australis TaxID=40998 RepID=A0A4U7B639_9PEZI|nr:hypothetical protein C1H76_2697 [Elsinoe australis]
MLNKPLVATPVPEQVQQPRHANQTSRERRTIPALQLLVSYVAAWCVYATCQYAISWQLGYKHLVLPEREIIASLSAGECSVVTAVGTLTAMALAMVVASRSFRILVE